MPLSKRRPRVPVLFRLETHLSVRARRLEVGPLLVRYGRTAALPCVPAATFTAAAAARLAVVRAVQRRPWILIRVLLRALRGAALAGGVEGRAGFVVCRVLPRLVGQAARVAPSLRSCGCGCCPGLASCEDSGQTG